MNIPTSENGSYRLAKTLIQDIQSEACLLCRDGLEEYCVAQQNNDKEKLASYSSSVGAHLDACVECAECYELLYLALLGDLPEPSAYPVPELSFLKPQAGANQQLLSALSQACAHHGQRLRLTLSQALLGLLPPAPSLALRSALARPIFDLRISWPEQPIDGLHMQALSDTSSLVNMHVRVHQAGRQWPELLPAKVALMTHTQHYYAQTDAFGEAVLKGIPVEYLSTATVEIELVEK